jgi:creatinine amidohydrolase
VGEERPRDGLPAVPPPAGWDLEGALPSAWLTADLSRTGVVGDTRGATADLGGQLFEALVAGWTERLEALLVSDWPPVVGAGGADPAENG